MRWENAGHGRTLADDAVDVDGSAVKLDEAFDDGKAKARTLAASACVMTDKTIENLG